MRMPLPLVEKPQKQQRCVELPPETVIAATYMCVCMRDATNAPGDKDGKGTEGEKKRGEVKGRENSRIYANRHNNRHAQHPPPNPRGN